MYIAMNRFTIFAGKNEVFEGRWKTRNSYLLDVPGFIRFRLLQLDDTHYSSYAEWESEQAFEDWTTSDSFRQAHSQPMPEGVFDGHPRLECWRVILEEPA